MSIRILVSIVVLLIAFGALESAILQESTQSAQSKTQAGSREWPNLDRVGGCGLKGEPHGDKEREAQNILRNRYHLPPEGFKNYTFEELRNILPQGELVDKKMKYPTSADENHKTAVSIVAYVNEVIILSCGMVAEKIDKASETQKFTLVPKLERRGVESASCYNTDETLCTTQILVTPNPTLPRESGRNVYVFNVTRRSRELAKGGYLRSNIGNDWSKKVLEEALEGKWVRFSGWLFFNKNYQDKAWVSDPNNKIGRFNDRESAWSLFPVMGIEVGVPPP